MPVHDWTRVSAGIFHHFHFEWIGDLSRQLNRGLLPPDYLLTHSFSGRALAILRVISNSGARTPGVDGILWNTPEAKSAAFSALRRHGYQPQPLRRVYIPKSNGELRGLGIPICRSYCTSSQGG
jgi:N-terminal domain of reverse transcriptase